MDGVLQLFRGMGRHAVYFLSFSFSPLSPQRNKSTKKTRCYEEFYFSFAHSGVGDFNYFLIEFSGNNLDGSIDDEGWGFSHLRIQPFFNSVDPISLGNAESWTDACGERENWKYEHPAESSYFWASFQCFRGLWGSENEWFSASFSTDREHDQIKVRVTIWMICSWQAQKDVLEMKMDGETVWFLSKSGDDSSDCALAWKGALEAPNVNWMNSYGCLDPPESKACFKEKTLFLPHSGVGTSNSFLLQFYSHAKEQSIEEGGWGISKLSITIPTMNIPPTDVDLGVGNWEDSCGGDSTWGYQRIYPGEPSKYFTVGNSCYRGIWANENEWALGSFFTTVPHDEIKINVRMWALCFPYEFTFRVEFEGNEIWRSQIIDSSPNCGKWNKAESEPWMDDSPSNCFPFLSIACYKVLDFHLAHSGIGAENSFSLQFFGTFTAGLLGAEYAGMAGWGFSDLSMESYYLDPVDLGSAWKDPCLIPSQFHFEDGSIGNGDDQFNEFMYEGWPDKECFHGMWGSSNSWVLGRFFTNGEDREIEIKLRVWAICGVEKNDYFRVELVGVDEVGSKERETSRVRSKLKTK